MVVAAESLRVAEAATATAPPARTGSGEAAAPHPPERSGRKRKDGLSAQIEVHDRHQFEIRSSYALAGGRGRQRYIVDTYFFIPRNVGLTRANYSRAQFYGDVTALVRLDVSLLPLDELADPRCPASPLSAAAAIVDEFRRADRTPPSRPLLTQVKLYAFLCTIGIKAEITDLSKRLRDADLSDPAVRERFERALDGSLARMRGALRAYRSVRKSFWPFEKIAHEQVPGAMRVADEYMSLFLEERLCLFVSSLDKKAPRADGSCLAARARARVLALASEEAAYRERYGYLTMSERTRADGEYFTYRASLLKKAVHNALYLDPREVHVDRYIRNAIGAVGAAIASIWALATQLPAQLHQLSGSAKASFFLAAVLAYVLKDRIKALTNEALTARLLRFDHTSLVSGESLSAFGLGMLRLRLREAMRFQHSAEVGSDVLEMRLAHRTVRHAEAAAEEVIHYRKVVDIDSREDTAELPDEYRVRDTLRVNVRPLLVRLDDPLDPVAFFDLERGSFGAAELPKVYHVNLVAKITREDASGRREQRLERMRVVLSKDGIVRVDEVERRPATVTERAPTLRDRLQRRRA
jgi:hypothetical protein